MEKINATGTYEVILENCHWEAGKDEGTMTACLTGVVDEGGSQLGRGATYYTSWNENYIKGGQNKGKTNAQATYAELKELGMEGSPANIGQLDGVRVKFVMEKDTYKGKERIRVQWVNPITKPPMEAAEIEAIFAAFEPADDEEAPEQAPAQPASEEETASAWDDVVGD